MDYSATYKRGRTSQGGQDDSSFVTHMQCCLLRRSLFLCCNMQKGSIIDLWFVPLRPRPLLCSKASALA